MKAKLIFNINVLDEEHCALSCRYFEKYKGGFCALFGVAAELLHRDDSGLYLRGQQCRSGKCEVKR